MSSFTNYTGIRPHRNKRKTTEGFRYYIGEKGSVDYVDVSADFVFDGASVPNIFGIFIQKVEPDTIMSACLHDWMYVHRKPHYTRVGVDLVFLESLIVYNIPRLLEQKKYTRAFISVFKYIIMTVGLILFSWVVWYKLDKKVLSLLK